MQLIPKISNKVNTVIFTGFNVLNFIEQLNIIINGILIKKHLLNICKNDKLLCCSINADIEELKEKLEEIYMDTVSI